jgi:hypothetical protein
MHCGYLAARIEYIGKHHRGAAEHMILKGHPFVDGDVCTLTLSPMLTFGPIITFWAIRQFSPNFKFFRI